MYSVEFPARPECNAQQAQTDCRYADPGSGFTFSARHWKVNLKSNSFSRDNPSSNLQNFIKVQAQSEEQEVLLNKATVTDGFAAADYRLGPKSPTSSTVHSAGQLINLGEKVVQLVHLSVEGKQAPPEEVLQRFVKSFRVEGGGQGLAPLPPSSAPLIQGALLKAGTFDYQTIVETALWSEVADTTPLDYSTHSTRRSIQRRRDKQREAIVITETGRTDTRTSDTRYWLDAKTLVPYRMVFKQTEFVTLLNKKQTSTVRVENIDGVLKVEFDGPMKGKSEHPVGEVPLFMPGAPPQLAVSTLPLEAGFLGSLRVFELGGSFGNKPHSDWRVLVQHAPELTAIAGLEAGRQGLLKVFKVELTEHTSESPRKLTMWIENSPARRIPQVEASTPNAQRSRTTVQMIRARR